MSVQQQLYNNNDIVLSAHVAPNADVFAEIMKLHVPVGASVCDVTYGKGVFWRKIAKEAYVLRATDIETGVDARSLPYENSSVDCVVLDPPYMEGLV